MHIIGYPPYLSDGHSTYIPENFMTNGILTRDYNPTKLVVATIVFLLLIILAFLLI